MLRQTSVVAAALFLGSPAFCQQDLGARLRRITGAPHEVRVRLDPLTHRAVRMPGDVGPGAKAPVYDNTCLTGYYFGLESAASSGGTQAVAVIDQGRIPDTSSAPSLTCSTGTADAYDVTAFEIAYCTTTGSPVDYITNVWNHLGGACPNNFGTAPDCTITVLGLPRSPSAGTVSCYIVTVNLDQPGCTLLGGSTNLTAERFAWSHQYPRTTGSDGPQIAGDPDSCGCAPCVGTIWERTIPSTNRGTGLGAADSFWIEQFGGTLSGCFFFGGDPFGSYHLRIDADDPPLPPAVDSFCDEADGSHAFCPCGPAGAGTASNPTGGCDIAQGAGVQADVLAQTSRPDAATIQGSGYPPALAPAAILLSDQTLEAFPVVFGDGLLCLCGAGVARVKGAKASGGTSLHAFTHAGGPGTFHYQIWFRNNVPGYCVTTGPGMGAFNLTNGRTLVW